MGIKVNMLAINCQQKRLTIFDKDDLAQYNKANTNEVTYEKR